jgi:hypothetical protein
MRRLIFVVAVLLFTFANALGQIAGNPENWCRNGAFPQDSESYSIATVKAKRGARVYFYGDDDDCPNAKNCRGKSYLIAKNQVIVSREFGKWACVWYQPKRGAETVGWIPSSNLTYSPGATPRARDWIGEWTFYENTITIAATKTENVYEVKGSAFWRGYGDNIHIGELDGTATLADGKLRYGFDGQYDCRATFSLVGKYLIGSDNLNCGGANVTFSGVYRRK